MKEICTKSQLILLILACLLFVNCGSTHDIQHDVKLNELKQIASETPVFPGFREIDSNYNIKSNIAVLSLYYESTTSYEEVKSFYFENLVQKGWRFRKEEELGRENERDKSKRLIFQKGDYELYVEYEGYRSDQAKFDYGVSYGWREH